MKKILVLFLLIHISFMGFSQEKNNNNIIIYPVKNHTLIWSFPNYWICDNEILNPILLFHINGYSIENSIILFGISLNDEISIETIEDYSIETMNSWINTVANYGLNYNAERINWNIIRKDNIQIIIFKYYCSDNSMYQYCAIMQTKMSNFIVVSIQLDTEHEMNDVFINDFKLFLESVIIYEGCFEENKQYINELVNLHEGEILIIK